jgi:transglutaminase-like putative cysteine protease
MHLSTVETLLEYEVLGPAHFCFNIEAAHWPSQTIVSEALRVAPEVKLHAFEDPGSGNRFFRFDAQPGRIAVDYKAEVEVQPEHVRPDLPELPVNQVPDHVLHYLYPTRYCESDVAGAFARETFGPMKPGLARVRAIVDWVRRNVEYKPNTTTSTTTAHEVLQQRKGVCRDFAHVAITLCRSLNIPARLVAGYVWFDEPPQDFHAVFEAWLGGRWVLFDPTGMAPVDRLVRIGTGRDAKDVAFCTSFGPVRLLRKQVWVLEHDAREPQPVTGPMEDAVA